MTRFLSFLSGFDAHLVIRAIAEDSVHIKRVKSILAKSVETFISFELQFRCDGCIANGHDHTDIREMQEEEEQEEEEEEKNPPDYCTCRLMETLLFKDSYRFLSSPLASLTDALKTKAKPTYCSSCKNGISCSQCATKPEIKHVFPNTHKFISETYGEQHLDLLLQKQIYPYSYIQSWDVLHETKLPSKAAFFNR